MTGEDGGGGGASCETTTDCAENQGCVDGVCVDQGEPPPDANEISCEMGSEAADSLMSTCFSRIQSGRLAPNLRGFDARFELYSDGTDKRRWVYLPPGSLIDDGDVDAWQFPVGTIFWQEFSSGTGERVETRMLEKVGATSGPAAWRPSVYLWTKDQTDAHRTRDGLPPSAEQDYAIEELIGYPPPSEQLCMDCHQGSADVVLGFSTLQLSNTELLGSIDVWQDYLSQPQESVAMVGTDTDQDVLGYLHANCGTCHSARGSQALAGMDLSYSIAGSTDLMTTNVFQTAVYSGLRITPGNLPASLAYQLVQDLSMPPAEVSNVRDSRFRNLLRDWIVALEWNTTILVEELPHDLSADGAGVSELGYPEIQDDAGQGRVFVRREPLQLRSRIVFPIDTTKTYRISGRFRSDAAVQSRLYFGLAPYRDDGTLINSWEANRVDSPAVVDLAATTPTSIETVSGDLAAWNQPPAAGWHRWIGIYYDGDTSHLPDYVLMGPGGGSTSASAGAFSSASGTTIALNATIPQEVLDRMSASTVVMNHAAGGSYHYTAASAQMVDFTWTELSGEISGESFNPGNTAFRPSTRFAKLLILANYNQADEGARLLFDDLRLEEVAGP